VKQKLWRLEQEHDVIRIFYYTRGWQQEGTAENTSGEPCYEPGRRVTEVNAGTREQGRELIHVANSHEDRAEEGRRSNRKHSANSLWERDEACMSVGASIGSQSRSEGFN